MKKLAIIIPVINLWDQYTRQCLDSIAKALEQTDLTPEELSIFIIDNASTDNTKAGVEKMMEKAPYLQYLRNDPSLPLAASWNQGVRVAQEQGFERFLILNNDILLHPKSIANLMRVFDQPEVYLASMLNIRGEVITAEDIYTLPDKEPSVSPGPDFSGFMIGKKTLDKLAAAGDPAVFDEDFKPAYFEDNDFHHRLKIYVGPMSAICTTEALFYHFGSRTQNQNPGQPVVPPPAFEKNRAYYIQKWGGEPGRETFTKPFNK